MCSALLGKAGATTCCSSNWEPTKECRVPAEGKQMHHCDHKLATMNESLCVLPIHPNPTSPISASSPRAAGSPWAGRSRCAQSRRPTAGTAERKGVSMAMALCMPMTLCSHPLMLAACNHC